jgi:hypothetical protein
VGGVVERFVHGFVETHDFLVQPGVFDGNRCLPGQKTQQLDVLPIV